MVVLSGKEEVEFAKTLVGTAVEEVEEASVVAVVELLGASEDTVLLVLKGTATACVDENRRVHNPETKANERLECIFGRKK